MLWENTSIAFVVDPSLRVLLWSNGLVEATSLTQDTVEGRDVSCLPFLSADNRDNTTAAIQELFREKEGGAKRRMVVALVPGASAAAATREILLQFTAAFYEDQQHVVCVGLKLEGALSSLLHRYAASETVSSLTSGTNSGIIQPEFRDETEMETQSVSSLNSGTNSEIIQPALRDETEMEPDPGTVSSLTSGTNSGIIQPELPDETDIVYVPEVNEDVASLTSGTFHGMTTARSVKSPNPPSFRLKKAKQWNGVPRPRKLQPGKGGRTPGGSNLKNPIPNPEIRRGKSQIPGGVGPRGPPPPGFGK
eukprot:FR739278.1.p1 GENE.FR739278.1~~FR739278.1.p1  ORF type:complete len:307 (+),score=39.42 FR739278.1:221-1141(+)